MLESMSGLYLMGSAVSALCIGRVPKGCCGAGCPSGTLSSLGIFFRGEEGCMSLKANLIISCRA